MSQKRAVLSLADDEEEEIILTPDTSGEFLDDPPSSPPFDDVISLVQLFAFILWRCGQGRKEMEAVEQRSIMWRYFRIGLFTGSTLAGIVGMGYNGQGSSQTIDKMLDGEEFSEFQLENMRRGTTTEPVSAEAYRRMIQAMLDSKSRELNLPEEQWPRIYLTFPGTFPDKEHPFVGTSPDGHVHFDPPIPPTFGDLYERYGRGKGGVEFKAPMRDVYPVIPPYYYVQIQSNMKTQDLDWMDFVAWTQQKIDIQHFLYDREYVEEFLYPTLLRVYFTEYLPELHKKVNGRRNAKVQFVKVTNDILEAYKISPEGVRRPDTQVPYIVFDDKDEVWKHINDQMSQLREWVQNPIKVTEQVELPADPSDDGKASARKKKAPKLSETHRSVHIGDVVCTTTARVPTRLPSKEGLPDLKAIARRMRASNEESEEPAIVL